MGVVVVFDILSRGHRQSLHHVCAKEQLAEQHLLLHSKLWTRRWPGLRFLLVRIGVASWHRYETGFALLFLVSALRFLLVSVYN